MKWTDHSKLEAAYGIHVTGWPSSVPLQNPSSLSVAQNRQVLEALRNGTMRFQRIGQSSSCHTDTSPLETSKDRPGAAADENMDISWAYQDPDEQAESVSPHVSLNAWPVQDWSRQLHMVGNAYSCVCERLRYRHLRRAAVLGQTSTYLPKGTYIQEDPVCLRMKKPPTNCHRNARG